MFISELSKKESIAFLNLLSSFALTDSVVKKEEKVLMEKYFKETNLSEKELVEMNYEDAIAEIKNSSHRVIDIIYFELMRVGLIDGEYQYEEVEFLERLSNDLNISRVKRFKIANYFYQFSDDEKNNYEVMRKMAAEIL